VSFDPDSNVNDESDLQEAKDSSPRNSTDAGREMRCSDGQSESAYASIRTSFDPVSNVNDESAVHSEKELSPRD
jgi:hypothetical protein